MRFPQALIAFFGVLFLLGIITTPWYLASFHTRAFDTNSPPTASDERYTRHSNGTIGPLLANDSDPDNDPMTVSLVTTPTNGSLSGIDGNSFSYTRNSSTWTGTDSFTYKACDNHSACSNVATVTINIVNQAPVAVNDTYNVHG